MGEWDSAYGAITTLADGDDFLVRQLSATPPAAGTLKRIASRDAAVAFYRGAILVLPADDNDAAGNAAAIQAADPGGAGIVKLAPVAWNIECGVISHNGSGFYWDCSGAWITASGTGDLFRLYDDSAYESRTVNGGGLIGYPFIDGTSTSGASAAFHGGDILDLKTHAKALNFTGSGAHGFLWDNVWAIAEQMDVDVWASNCATHFEWTQNPGSGNTFCYGSFERSKMRLRFSQINAAFPVFVFSNGVYFDGSFIEVKGNAAGTDSGAITTAMFYATGTSPAGSQDGTGVVSSNVNATEIQCNIELDPNGLTDWTYNPTTFKTDGDCFFGYLTGRLDFGTASKAWTPTSSVIGFFGETDGADPYIISQTAQPQLFQGPGAFGTYAGAASLATNGTISAAASYVQVAPAAASTGVILALGAYDGQILTVVNSSANLITFATSATSHLASSTGSNETITTKTAAQFFWSANTSLWYRVKIA